MNRHQVLNLAVIWSTTFMLHLTAAIMLLFDAHLLASALFGVTTLVYGTLAIRQWLRYFRWQAKPIHVELVVPNMSGNQANLDGRRFVVRIAAQRFSKNKPQ